MIPKMKITNSVALWNHCYKMKHQWGKPSAKA